MLKKIVNHSLRCFISLSMLLILNFKAYAGLDDTWVLYQVNRKTTKIQIEKRIEHKTDYYYQELASLHGDSSKKALSVCLAQESISKLPRGGQLQYMILHAADMLFGDTFSKEDHFSSWLSSIITKKSNNMTVSYDDSVSVWYDFLEQNDSFLDWEKKTAWGYRNLIKYASYRLISDVKLSEHKNIIPICSPTKYLGFLICKDDIPCYALIHDESLIKELKSSN